MTPCACDPFTKSQLPSSFTASQATSEQWLGTEAGDQTGIGRLIKRAPWLTTSSRLHVADMLRCCLFFPPPTIHPFEVQTQTSTTNQALCSVREGEPLPSAKSMVTVRSLLSLLFCFPPVPVCGAERPGARVHVSMSPAEGQGSWHALWPACRGTSAARGEIFRLPARCFPVDRLG